MLRAIASVCFVAVLLLPGCENVDTEDAGNVVTLADLQLDSSDIQGWSVPQTTFFASIAELAAGSFDGEAYYYRDDLGLTIKQAFGQSLSGQSGAGGTVYVLELASATEAVHGYTEKRQELINNGNPVLAVSGFDAATATLFKSNQDHLTYAHFDRFLVRLTNYGFPSDGEAQTQIASFLGFYRSATQ